MFGVPSIAIVYIAVAIFGHVFLTRLRPGWHITAIGGSRRSAYNSGIPVRRTIALCYVACGVLTAVGALFFAARLGTVGGDIGVGLEVTVLTATVLGGITLGGGKGSVAKALVGTLIVLLITNGLTTLNAPRRRQSAGLGEHPARRGDDRHPLAEEPRPHHQQGLCQPDLSRAAAGRRRPRSARAARSRRTTSCATWTLIGLGRIEAPEDVILDRDDNLYAGSRHGDIMRFFAPDYQRMEVFAHIGGQPLGMAFDRKDNLYVCIGGMGLYRIAPDGAVEKATDETNRSLFSVNDDSRLRLADDLDIADGGLRLLFRGDDPLRNGRMAGRRAGGARQRPHHLLRSEHRQDAHRGARPRNFPTASAWRATASRSCSPRPSAARSSATGSTGPKKGAIETVIDNLPGYPDNINLASDGNYWLALVGMRSPALDLAWRMPGFRRRMAKRVPVDEWLFPNINTGCVVKFNEKGEDARIALGPASGVNHPMITSMREHRGYLYLGGIANNRIGRYKLEGADPNFVQYDKRWGTQPVIARCQGLRQPLARPRRGDHHGAVVRRRAEAQPEAGSGRNACCSAPRPRISPPTATALFHRRRADASLRLDGERCDRASRASTSRSRRSCCLPGGGLAVALAGREVRVYPDAAAAKPSAAFAERRCRAVNALAPALDGDADRNRRLGRPAASTQWAQRSDGARPHRTRSRARPQDRGNDDRRSPRASATPSAPAPRASGRSSAKAGGIASLSVDARRKRRKSSLAHLPVYPSRLSPASVRRLLADRLHRAQPAGRVRAARDRPTGARMMAEIEPRYWIAPRLRSGKSFKEPMQGAHIKTMGVIKPWAPPRSYGLVIRLDADGAPLYSLHSRVDGVNHGVVSAVELDGDLVVVAKGPGRVLRLPARRARAGSSRA